MESATHCRAYSDREDERHREFDEIVKTESKNWNIMCNRWLTKFKLSFSCDFG